jgi:predicted nucleic acid-binding protein
MTPGLLDTNVFIHAHASDRWAAECRAFLTAVESGRVTAVLEPLVLHELSYALPHYVKQMTRDQVGEYLLMVLRWEGVQGDKDTLAETVMRWRATPGLAFVDAYLATLAHRRGCPVFSKNVRELTAQGAVVPVPLPSSAE